MPLLDPFHPPLSPHHHWETLHARWAYAIADALNGGLLRPGYLAEGPVTLRRVEVDLATQEKQTNAPPTPRSGPSAGGVATSISSRPMSRRVRSAASAESPGSPR